MTQSNRLPTLADEAKQAHAETLHHAQKAADRALAAGAALNEAKALCAHGTWGDWLAETGIPERSAQRYMKLHSAGCNSAMVADMGTAKAETIAALGLLHSGFPYHFDIYNTRRMTPEETAQARAEMEGIAAGEDKKREGWLQYGRALNEARTLLPDDEAFESWIAANGLGQMDGREVSPNERDAAMRAAREETGAVR